MKTRVVLWITVSFIGLAILYLLASRTAVWPAWLSLSPETGSFGNAHYQNGNQPTLRIGSQLAKGGTVGEKSTTEALRQPKKPWIDVSPGVKVTYKTNVMKISTNAHFYAGKTVLEYVTNYNTRELDEISIDLKATEKERQRLQQEDERSGKTNVVREQWQRLKEKSDSLYPGMSFGEVTNLLGAANIAETISRKADFYSSELHWFDAVTNYHGEMFLYYSPNPRDRWLDKEHMHGRVYPYQILRIQIDTNQTLEDWSWW